jgi:uncharacterized protein (TIGR02444 family)
MALGFWDFSLRLYALPGVAPACLRCQDEAGADVNLVLCLLWHAMAGRLLASEEIAGLEAQVADWRKQVVEPLRSLRRALKSRSLDNTGAFRQRIKAMELEAERLEQEALSQAATGLPHRAPVSPGEAASANLRNYETTLLQPLPREAVSTFVEALSQLVRT